MLQPSATLDNKKERDLNSAIYETITKDETRWRNWAYSQKDPITQTWKGEIPYVYVIISRPFCIPF